MSKQPARGVAALGLGGLAAVGFLAVWEPALGQAADAQPAAQAQPDQAAEARKVIDRARSAYLALKSYRDKVKGSYVWQAEGMDERSTRWEVGNAFAAPCWIAATTERDAMITDGKNLFKLSIAAKRYTKRELPDPFDPQEHTEGLPSSYYVVAPTITVLARGERNPELLLRTIKELTGVRTEERNGVAGKLVTAKGLADPNDQDSPEVEIELFFRDSDGLLTELHYDYTEANNAASDEVLWDDVRMSFKVTDIEVNPGIPPGTFKPPEDFQEVAVLDFEQSREASDQLALVGKPAPVFDGEGLDGKPVRLEDYRGRVVVLDFWATWCGPCVAAIPHVQKLSERFADKPVTVLGINQDRDTDQVAEFVSEKKITFRHLMDDGTVGESYLVSGIPCTVLIDAMGVVQDVSTGFAPGQEGQLASKIELLLEGKNLRTDEELARIRQETEEKRSRPALSFPASNPERVTLSSFKARAFYSRHMTWTASVEGDLATELITPGQDNSIEIIDRAAESVRTVRFRGLPRRGRVNSVAPVRVKGERHWLVGYTTLGRGDDGGTLIGLYNDAGDQIWRFEPDLPENSFVQSYVGAGDLTGDEVPEMVVGLSATRTGGDRGLEFGPGNQAGAIIVLSAEGEVLSQKATGPVDLVFVGKPKEPGQPGRLLVAVGGRLQRVNFKPDASGPDTPKPEPDDKAPDAPR